MPRSAETSRPFPAGSALAAEPGDPVRNGSGRNTTAPATRLPFVFARDHGVIVTGRRVILAPHASATGLREAARRLGPGPVETRDETLAGFEAALARHYESAREASDVSFELEEDGIGPGISGDLLDDSGDAPVIRLVNSLLAQAVTAGASDLHVEPSETGLRVRMRIDGFLREVMHRDDVPVRRVVSRLKVMAGLDIAETRLPQDGRIPLELGGRRIDTRVSSLPGQYGERIVLRILDRSAGLMELEALGLSPRQEALLARLSALPNGIILATGPTGSGKTTTLYSLLKLADRDERNIVTVEDPVEYDLPGISQSQVRPEIGMTFAAGLRATLRQDPDVILVGEIRDEETASVAAQAALTGHLVFSSLHANGSVGAVVRLRDLGLDDYLIGATLRGVIAQRLLRRLCPACRKTHPPSPAEAAQFTDRGLPVPQAIAAPAGCETCHGTGYQGRLGVFEMIEVGEALRGAIDRGATEAEMAALALKEAETLIGQGLAEVAAGETSLSEVLRVVGDVA